MSIRRVDDAYAAPYRTDWGDGWVYVRDAQLVGVELPGEGQIDLTGSAAAAPGAADSKALSSWAEALEAYFAGERTTWTADEVPLAGMRLGTFERTVYETLLSVPAGQTVSYGELAEMAGYPRAARAVGNAMAANPIPIVVPCHRVIRSDGSMGNYGNDPARKKRLLIHEGWSAPGRSAGRGPAGARRSGRVGEGD